MGYRAGLMGTSTFYRCGSLCRRACPRHARNGRQAEFWADMQTAPREHMEIAFQQRRQQIVGDCRQLKWDVDSYNENHNSGEPLQMVFDFTLDLEEIEALASIT